MKDGVSNLGHHEGCGCSRIHERQIIQLTTRRLQVLRRGPRSALEKVASLGLRRQANTGRISELERCGHDSSGRSLSSVVHDVGDGFDEFGCIHTSGVAGSKITHCSQRT
jgi:hypothetical protein